MSVGKVPSLAELNAMLAGDAQAVENVMTGVLRRWGLVEDIGVDGLMAEPYNMPQADAETMFANFNYLATVAGVWYGTGAQPDPFDFSDATAKVRGGQ